jgi:hypothetical protein
MLGDAFWLWFFRHGNKTVFNNPAFSWLLQTG